MKKKFLSLVCSIAVLATMISSFGIIASADAAVSGPSIVVTTDATGVVKAGDTFNVSVKLEGFTGFTSWSSKDSAGFGISSIQFNLFLPENDYVTSGDDKSYPAGATTTNWEQTAGGYFYLYSWAGAGANMIISTAPYTLASVPFTAIKDFDVNQGFALDTAEAITVVTTQKLKGQEGVSVSYKYSDNSLKSYTLMNGEYALGASLSFGAPSAGKVKPEVSVTGATGTKTGSFYYDVVVDTKDATVNAINGITGSITGSDLVEGNKTKNFMLQFGGNATIAGSFSFAIGVNGAVPGATYTGVVNVADNADDTLYTEASNTAVAAN